MEGPFLFLASCALVKISGFRKSNSRGKLIILEGLDGTGKTTTSRELARRLKIQCKSTPPKSMLSFRQYFDRIGGPQRAAYYMVGNFIAASEIETVLEGGESVILDRYYASSKAYIMGRDLNNALPAIGSEEYAWPEELLKPDYMFVLQVPEACRTRRLAGRSDTPETTEEEEIRLNTAKGERINEAYVRFGCRVIDADQSTDNVVEEIMSYIEIM